MNNQTSSQKSTVLSIKNGGSNILGVTMHMIVGYDVANYILLWIWKFNEALN